MDNEMVCLLLALACVALLAFDAALLVVIHRRDKRARMP